MLLATGSDGIACRCQPLPYGRLHAWTPRRPARRQPRVRTLARGGALFPVFPLGFSGAEEAEKLGVTVSSPQVRSSGPQLAELARLLDAGTIRVAIDSTYPLADARKAYERAAGGHIRGKIVLTVVS